MREQVKYILPTELASLFINDDWSVVDNIGDDLYEESITMFLQELDHDGIEIIDVIEDTNHFCKYHDLADYGVKAAMCSEFIAH